MKTLKVKKEHQTSINQHKLICTYAETIIKIGLEFGNRDHSTVLHSNDKINNEIQNDENNIRQVIEYIKNKIVN